MTRASIRVEEQMQVLAHSLALEYLEESKRSPAQALEAATWDHPRARSVCTAETLGEELHARYLSLLNRSLLAVRYVHAVRSGAPTRRVASLRRKLSREDRAHIDAVLSEPASPELLLPDLHLADGALDEEIASLEERALRGTEELRPEKLRAALQREDGSRARGPWEWLRSRRAVEAFDAVLLETFFGMAMERLAREQAEVHAAQQQDRAESLEEQLRKQRGVARLGTHVVLPQALLQSGWGSSDTFVRRLKEAEQGELFLPEDAREVLRELSELTAEQTQLGQMTPHQVRALVGVFRLFSMTGEGPNGTFRETTLPIDARLMYQAAEVDHRNGRACRALFQALNELSQRQIGLHLLIKDPERGWSGVAEKKPVFGLRLVWHEQQDGRKRRTEKEATAIARAWVQGRSEMFGRRLPLPDQYVIELPAIMQRIFGRMVLTGDILSRLDRGAKAVRGKTEGFSDLDWRLFIEITQRTQSKQPSETGETPRSFVDRDALLIDLYGPEAIAKARSRGDYHRHYVRQYERSVQVIAHADVAVRVEAGREVRRGGVRDVFELLPEVVARGKRQRAMPQQPLQLTAKRRTRPA